MQPKISVVVPVYNYAKHLKKTLESIKNQSFKNFELIVVDDCSTDWSAKVARIFAGRVIINKKNRGPAVSRNRGIKAAKAGIIAFTDSDCIAAKDWLKNILKGFSNGADAVMGNTRILKSTFLGDSISALGFPGGANAGFENMWHVSKEGFTSHITSCNFAARKKTFRQHGMFDESFPLAGGEDPELSYRWSRKGVKIRYCQDAVVYHEPRTSLISFIKWMVYRGRSNYYFKEKIGNVSGFVKLRLWSSKNIIRKYIFNPRIFVIVPLLFLSFLLQQIGYHLEKKRMSSRSRTC